MGIEEHEASREVLRRHGTPKLIIVGAQSAGCTVATRRIDWHVQHVVLILDRIGQSSAHRKIRT